MPIRCALLAVTLAAVAAPGRVVTAAEPSIGPPAPIDAPPVWAVFDAELKPRAAAGLISLDDQSLVVARDGESDVTLRRDQSLAIVPASWLLPALSTPWSMLPGGTLPRGLATPILELTDGTRIVGAPAPALTTGEMIGWAHPSLPDTRVKLEQVRHVVFHPEARATPASAEPPGPLADRIRLINGDQLSGLVTGFSQGSAPGRVSVGIEVRAGAGEPSSTRTFDLDRVASITLANPPSPSPVVRLWLDDGSIIGGSAVAFNTDGEITLKPVSGDSATPSAITLPIVRLRALALAGSRLAALAAQPFTTSGPSWATPPAIERDDAMTPILDAAPVRLRPGSVVTFALPPGTRRITGVLMLPEESRLWGDCTVTLAAAGKSILTARLTSQAPHLSFNSALTGPTLSITIEPGEHGSVQDEIVLQRALLLLEAK